MEEDPDCPPGFGDKARGILAFLKGELEEDCSGPGGC